FVPLVARQACCHGQIAAEQYGKSTDPFTRARVHLVRHGTGTDLPGFETLGTPLCSCHQPEGCRKSFWPRRYLAKGRNHVEVQRARIDLTHVLEHVREAKVCRDSFFQGVESFLISSEQIEHILGGAHRSLDAPERIALDQFVDSVVGLE